MLYRSLYDLYDYWYNSCQCGKIIELGIPRLGAVYNKETESVDNDTSNCVLPEEWDTMSYRAETFEYHRIKNNCTGNVVRICGWNVEYYPPLLTPLDSIRCFNFTW